MNAVRRHRRGVSMLEIHSRDDDVVPYRGREPQRGCPDGLAVEHIAIDGDPHYWYEHSAERAWRFFRGRRRSPGG